MRACRGSQALETQHTVALWVVEVSQSSPGRLKELAKHQVSQQLTSFLLQVLLQALQPGIAKACKPGKGELRLTDYSCLSTEQEKKQ